MSDPIITVDGLGKAYRLGLKEEKYPTFRDALVGAAAAPLRRFRRLSDRRSSDEELFWALKDVSFEVNRGEVVGIIGRNGAGKSTLLKILSRIVEPTAGRAILRGRVASLLEVGTGFHPELTGRENIYLNGSILGMKKREIDRKFDEIVAFAEVEKFLDTPVKRYSSGMYVRLAFAVAAHLEPEILIVDEVLAVGDAEFQKKCLGKMQEVARGGGRTVLFVSHQLGAVRELCTSIVLLTQGRSQLFDDVDEGLNLYISHASESMQQHSLPVSGRNHQLLQVNFTSGTDERGIRSLGPLQCDVQFRTLKRCETAAYLKVEDAFGATIFGLDSRDFDATSVLSIGEIGSCRFEVGSLPLMPGLYKATIMLRNDFDFSHWTAPIAFSFEVAETFSYGTRVPDRSIHGPIALRAEVAMKNLGLMQSS